jgi:hypothetical protein
MNEELATAYKNWLNGWYTEEGQKAISERLRQQNCWHHHIDPSTLKCRACGLSSRSIMMSRGDTFFR